MSTSIQHEVSKTRVERALAAFNTKRARVDSPSSVEISSIGSPNRATRTESSTPNRGGSSTDSFRPWSRDDLLSRISTYKIHTWPVRSWQLSPVKCARNGWINDDFSTLKCPICKSIIIAQIPDDLTDAEEVQWIGRLAEQLQTSHDSKCPWKGRECTEAMYSLPLATSRETVDSICQFSADLLSFGDNLPETTNPLSAFRRNLLCDLKPRVLEIRESASSGADNSNDACQNEQAFSALVLSLFGWRVDRSISRPTVKCEMCFRSAGLWLFRSVADRLEVQSGDPGTGAKDHASGGSSDNSDSKDDVSPNFNAVSEHRSFCWWAYAPKQSNATPEDNAPLQSGSATGVLIPGWQKVISSVLRARTVYKSEEAGSSSGDYSNSGESESSDTDDDKGSSGHSAKQQRIVSDLEYGAELGALKRFKPFNISAISSAAEAFGIPFSTSLLVEAAKRLREPTKAQNTGISHSESDLQPSLLNASESDSSVRLGLAEDAANVADGNADDVEEDIPAPIDMSGLASVLGDSTLACALEDPEKAQLILEYVKGLLKAKNQATQV